MNKKKQISLYFCSLSCTCDCTVALFLNDFHNLYVLHRVDDDDLQFEHVKLVELAGHGEVLVPCLEFSLF